MLTSCVPILKCSQIPHLPLISLLLCILACECGKTVLWAVVYERENFSATFTVHIFLNEFALPHARAFDGYGLSLGVTFLLSHREHRLSFNGTDIKHLNCLLTCYNRLDYGPFTKLHISHIFLLPLSS